MNKILALAVIIFAFAAPSAFAKNDYSCDKKFIFFPGGPEGGPLELLCTMVRLQQQNILVAM